MSADAVKHIMATIFSAQNALRDLAPDFKWAGMGNLLGDYGEFYCIENYGLTKAAALLALFLNSKICPAFGKDMCRFGLPYGLPLF